MIKKMFFAAAITGLVAGVTLPVVTPADAASSGCLKAAKAKFATDRKSRVAYRKECKAHYKAYRTAQKPAKKAAS
jgi:hypothetical protein